MYSTKRFLPIFLLCVGFSDIDSRMDKICFENKLDWQWLVTAKGLDAKPFHRWFVFPHSFSDEVVGLLIKEWGLSKKDYLLDPFVGSGTSLISAAQLGIRSVGYDISPLSVFISKAKTYHYDYNGLLYFWNDLKHIVSSKTYVERHSDYPDSFTRHFP